MSDHPIEQPTPEEAKRSKQRACQAARRARLKAEGLCCQCGIRQPPRSGRTLCQVCLDKVKEKRLRLMAIGMCQCGVRKRAKGRSTCDVCRKSSLRSGVALNKRRKNQRLCTKCEEPVVEGSRLCASHREKERQGRLALRHEAFNAYGGPRCACCETEVTEHLTLEHPDNDGGEHRKALGGRGGTGFYRRLKQLGFPQVPRMIVMCFNCNIARNCFGYCPCQKSIRLPTVSS